MCLYVILCRRNRIVCGILWLFSVLSGLSNFCSYSFIPIPLFLLRSPSITVHGRGSDYSSWTSLGSSETSQRWNSTSVFPEFVTN